MNTKTQTKPVPQFLSNVFWEDARLLFIATLTRVIYYYLFETKTIAVIGI